MHGPLASALVPLSIRNVDEESQLLLTAGKATEDETTTVEVREVSQEAPPQPPVRRTLTLRERVLGYVRR